eukprot:11190251-Lingulodinium_polyedra.AAC.1
MRAPENWRARGVRERVICEPLRPWTVDLTASLRSVLRALRNDAFESTIRRRSGSLIARSRVLARASFSGVRAECACVRLASRCCGGWSIRSHRFAAFAKRYATMRSNRPCATVAVRKSHVRAIHARG